MLVSKNAKICLTPNAKHKICVTPNAKDQCKPMEYRLRWVPSAKFSRWPCTFHGVFARFICVAVGYPTRTQFAVEYGLYIVTQMAVILVRAVGPISAILFPCHFAVGNSIPFCCRAFVSRSYIEKICHFIMLVFILISQRKLIVEILAE